MSIEFFQHLLVTNFSSLLLQTREYTRCDGLLQLLNQVVRVRAGQNCWCVERRPYSRPRCAKCASRGKWPVKWSGCRTSVAVDRGTGVGCGKWRSRGSQQDREHDADDDGAVFFFPSTASIKTSGAEPGKVRENIARRCAVTGA